MYLNCHSYYSFLYGTMSPAELVKRGKDAGANALVLTDINNTSAWYDFLCTCEAEKIKPILGAEFRHEAKREFIAIARNNKGIYDLNKFLSEYSETKYYEAPPESEHLYLIYSPGKKKPEELKDNEFIGIRRTDVNKLYHSEYLNYADKLVALCPVTYKDPADHQTHKIIQAIDQNTLLTKVDLTNIAKSEEYFVPVDAVEQTYWHFPFILKNTQKLIDSCQITMDLHAPKNKQSFTGSKKGDKAMLQELALKGYYDRYGDNAEAYARVHKELKIIDKMNFSAYYLITWDIIRYAGSRGYHHIGRGSGANSIVAYCIRISNVDPIKLDLYFERFINPYRVNPPDFDVDFSWDERDDIISYIFEKYGKEHVCLLATYTTFQRRSIVRELGKIHGLPKGDIDLLVEEPKAKDRHHAMGPEIYEQAKTFIKSNNNDYWERYGKENDSSDDLPTHLSIHAGGILITEESLYNYTALDLLPKGFPVCQFDMHVAEAWGFYKYDILSQRGLGHIKEAVDIIWENRKEKIDIHRAADFFEDEGVRQQLLAINTIGCFYIESPAMRGLLSKVHCDNFISLVAASSIIRPGVAQSGMMREYITRANNPEKIEYIHPKFKEVLQETYGVMVYQEDVIKIAHHFGGLDMGEADILRRGMSGKSRTKKEFLILQDKYYENCRNFGYSEEMAREVWRQIESFSGFSFCKAHSASFAVESYQSLYLKTYYPLEFMVAVINNFGGFYGTEQYVHEARISGANIEPPCINHSNYKTRIIGKTIYLGFVHVQNLENTLMKKIIAEREQNGPYLGLYDFIKRVQVSKEQLNLLIRMGSLRFTGKSKQVLLWEKNNYLSGKPVPAMAALLEEEPECETLPELEVRPLEDVFDQMELLGFPLCSPFELIKTKNLGEIILAHEMRNYMHKKVRMVGYYVAKKDVRTSNGKLMNFGTWVDHNGKFFDSVHFPIQLDAYPFTGKGCYLMLGKMVHDFGFPSLEVEKMVKLPMIDDPRY